MQREDCAFCGHDKDTHHKETRPTYQRDTPLMTVHTRCLAAYCECEYYCSRQHLGS